MRILFVAMVGSIHTARWINQIADQGWDIHLFPSLDSDIHLEFRVGDVLEALPDEKYSVVISSNVLEHLPGRPAFLRHVQETLQPKCVLIRVPVFERDWLVPLNKEISVECRLDPTHETEYTLETFFEEMKEADLTISHLEVR